MRRPLYSGRRNSVRSETLFSTMRFFAASRVPSGEHVCHVGAAGQEGEGVWNLACHRRVLHAGMCGGDILDKFPRRCFGVQLKQYGVTLCAYKILKLGMTDVDKRAEPARCG